MKIYVLFLISMFFIMSCTHDHDQYRGDVNGYTYTNFFKIASNGNHLDGDLVVFAAYIDVVDVGGKQELLYAYLMKEHAENKITTMAIHLDPISGIDGEMIKDCAGRYSVIRGKLNIDKEYGYPNVESHRIHHNIEGKEKEICFTSSYKSP
ncbi:MAG: hypothetical protein ACRBBW_21615 [Cellvibrionaceae bacterium]